MKAKYCKCKNIYTINNCDCDKEQFYYWSQGIGSTINQADATVGHVPRAFSDAFNKGFL